MTVLFTADTHLGSHRTINIHERPFANSAEMDEALVANWNAAVRPEDESWHLGDFGRRAVDVEGLLARLNGRKHLLRGNNGPNATLAAAGWSASATTPRSTSTVAASRCATTHSAPGTASTGERSNSKATATDG